MSIDMVETKLKVKAYRFGQHRRERILQIQIANVTGRGETISGQDGK